MGWKSAPNKRRVVPFRQENNEASGTRTANSDAEARLRQHRYRRRNAITHLCAPSSCVIQQVANTLRRLGDEFERRASRGCISNSRSTNEY